MTDKTTIQEGTLSSDAVMAQLRERLSKVNSTVSQQEVSAVIEVADGIARVAGLRSAMAGELLEFTSSVTGATVSVPRWSADITVSPLAAGEQVEPVTDPSPCTPPTRGPRK